MQRHLHIYGHLVIFVWYIIIHLSIYWKIQLYHLF